MGAAAYIHRVMSRNVLEERTYRLRGTGVSVER